MPVPAVRPNLSPGFYQPQHALWIGGLCDVQIKTSPNCPRYVLRASVGGDGNKKDLLAEVQRADGGCNCIAGHDWHPDVQKRYVRSKYSCSLDASSPIVADGDFVPVDREQSS